MSDDKITFQAAFPPIQSAIRITGNGDGMRVQLDIPESEMGNAVRLVLLRECPLEVTIRSLPKDTSTNVRRAISRRAAKRRERQGDPGM